MYKHEKEIQRLIVENKTIEAIHYALDILKDFGIDCPRNPGKFDFIKVYAITRKKLTGISIDQLADLPEINNQKTINALKIIVKIIPVAFITAPKIFSILILKGLNVSIHYGNSPESVFIYACYGGFLCGKFYKFKQGKQFGELALHMLRSNPKKLEKVKCKILFVVSAFIIHWHDHANKTIDLLNEAYLSGKTHDIEFAAISRFFCSRHSCLIGNNLSDLKKDIILYGQNIKELEQDKPSKYNDVLIITITGFEDPIVLSQEEIKLDLPEEETGDKIMTFLKSFSRLYLQYLKGDYESAYENGKIADKNLDGITGMICNIPFLFYFSLTMIALFSDEFQNIQKKLFKKISKYFKKLCKISSCSPENTDHKIDLLRAEIYRLKGKYFEAEKMYGLAIENARKNQYLNDEALAYELAGRYFAQSKKKQIAQNYLINAYCCYAKWGAKSICYKLENEFLEKGFSFPAEFSEFGIDLPDIMKLTQNLSQKITEKTVLQCFVEIVLLKSDAQKALVLFPDSNNFFIKIKAQLNADQISYEYNHMKLENEVPFDLNKILIHDSDQKNTLMINGTYHPYMIQKKACYYLLSKIKFKNDLKGILILQKKNVFAPSFVNIVEHICSQAAISLENASDYQRAKNHQQELIRFKKELKKELLKTGQHNAMIEVLEGVKLSVTEKLLEIKEEAIEKLAGYNHLITIQKQIDTSIQYMQENI
jgi:hypothetical protein